MYATKIYNTPRMYACPLLLFTWDHIGHYNNTMTTQLFILLKVYAYHNINYLLYVTATITQASLA